MIRQLSGGRNTGKSVCAKSLPVQRIGNRSCSARAYVQQSPKLSFAGCRPLPYRRQASIPRSASSAVKGRTRTWASTIDRAARPAESSIRDSRTIPSSRTVGAAINRSEASHNCSISHGRVASLNAMAASADESTTTALTKAGRARRTPGFPRDYADPRRGGWRTRRRGEEADQRIPAY